MKRIIAVLVAAAAVALIVVLLLRGGGDAEIQNVVLISIDTLRADHVGCYGYPKEITPNIDAAARRAAVFENTYAPAPITLPSHTSMLTGTTPLYHRVHDNTHYFVGGYNVSLAEMLKEEGFVTGAIVSAEVLNSDYGLDQGFDEYADEFEQVVKDVVVTERKAIQTTQAAYEWLERHKDERFFLFLHYFDPHLSYLPPAPFDRRFKESPYAGEIAYTDHCIGLVLRRLKELGLYESTLLVITADHGEMLGEHGEKTHAFFVYQSALKVPLIIKAPGMRRGRKVKENVGVIDIAPTICDFLGVAGPEVMQGTSLKGYLDGGAVEPAAREYYFESFVPTKYGCNRLMGIMDGGWKYIETTRPELYDLENDAKEERNLAAVEEKRANLLSGKLAAMVQRLQYEGAEAAEVEVDSETMERLGSLGYVSESRIEVELGMDPAREDAKDLVEFHNMNAAVNVAFNNNRFDEARELCNRMLDMLSGYPLPHVYLGKIAFRGGDREGGYAEYRRYFDTADPEWRDGDRDAGVYAGLKRRYVYLALAHREMGTAYLQDERYEEAVFHLEQSLKLTVGRWQVRQALGVALGRMGRFEEARGQLEQVLAAEPESAAGQFAMADVLRGLKRYDEAEAHYLRSVELDEGLGVRVWFSLGQMYAEQQRYERAAEHLGRAVSVMPNHPEILDALAAVYLCDDEQVRDVGRAVFLAGKACEVTRNQRPQYLLTLARAYAGGGDYEKASETAELAERVAMAAGDEKLVREIEGELAQYESQSKEGTGGS